MNLIQSTSLCLSLSIRQRDMHNAFGINSQSAVLFPHIHHSQQHTNWSSHGFLLFQRQQPPQEMSEFMANVEKDELHYVLLLLFQPPQSLSQRRQQQLLSLNLKELVMCGNLA